MSIFNAHPIVEGITKAGQYGDQSQSGERADVAAITSAAKVVGNAAVNNCFQTNLSAEAIHTSLSS